MGTRYEYRSDNPARIEEMVGVTMKSVKNVDNDELIFEGDNGKRYIFYHAQDCCESVQIDDVCGELSDLVGEPLVQAEEVSSEDHDESDYESVTWTFYKFATRKGYVTVKWIGSSNGYYSESVDFRIDE